MSFFSSLLSSAPKPSQGARLLDRLESSTQLEDRRSAIAEFNELTAAEPVRLIDKGMAVLVQLLREEDTQLTRDVLETLSNLMDPEVPRGVVAETGEVKAVHNASVFLGSDSHLLEVLNSSEDGDLYVRFHAVQLVMKLLSRARRQTQENVLNQPATVGRVLQLAEDRREIVRNEVLLLLARLGEGSAGLQNILAFQGAFEQLLSIVESEGKEEGGLASVIVHDCLRIATSLLEHNVSSCRFFRESGCLQRVPALLQLPASHSRAHATTATLACELLGCLLAAGGDVASPLGAAADAETGSGSATSAEESAPAPATTAAPDEKLKDDIAATQTTLSMLGMIPLLVSLCTDAATATDPSLRLQALGTLAELVRGHPNGVAELLTVRVARRATGELANESALQRILYTGIRSSSAALRGTTVHIFRCVFHNNDVAQRGAAAFLVGSIGAGAPSAEPVMAAAPSALPTAETPPVTAVTVKGGPDVARQEHAHAYMAHAANTLFSANTSKSATDVEASGSATWVASGVLAAVLYRNADVKRMLLRLPLTNDVCSDVPDGAGILLLQWLARQLSGHVGNGVTRPLVLLSLLQLLLTWIADCADAIAAFTAPMANLPALVDAFSVQREEKDVFDVHLRGHVAGLLGACLHANLDTRADASGQCEARQSRAVVLSMLKQRIGLQAYSDAWEELLASEPFAAAMAGGTRWSSRKCESLLSGSAVLGGAVLYTHEMAVLLNMLFANARAAVLDGHAQPAQTNITAHQSPPVASAQAIVNGLERDAALDPAIESFKSLIASQDAKQKELVEELAQLREQHAVILAELDGARATAGCASAHREHLEELTKARSLAEADARTSEDELRVAREEVARTTTELEALAKAYAQMEHSLSERDMQVRALSNGTHADGTPSTMVNDVSVSESNTASIAVLQAHVDGLQRDKAALQADAVAQVAQLHEVESQLDDARDAVRSAEKATESACADAETLRKQLASAEAAREMAETMRDDAEAARVTRIEVTLQGAAELCVYVRVCPFVCCAGIGGSS